jgi:hypothetical protein
MFALAMTTQPDPLINSTTNGMGDINETLFLSPVNSGIKDFTWGFGPTVTAPSASDAILGTGKALLGPNSVIVTTPGHWVIGVLANNQWSVGGAPGRPPVNFFTSQYFINYNFPGGDGWYFSSSPIITADWRAAPGQQWTVPLEAASAAYSKSVINRLVRQSRDFTMSSTQIIRGPGRCACMFHSYSLTRSKAP